MTKRKQRDPWTTVTDENKDDAACLTLNRQDWQKILTLLSRHVQVLAKEVSHEALQAKKLLEEVDRELGLRFCMLDDSRNTEDRLKPRKHAAPWNVKPDRHDSVPLPKKKDPKPGYYIRTRKKTKKKKKGQKK